jgi:hypothetical protein
MRKWNDSKKNQDSFHRPFLYFSQNKKRKKPIFFFSLNEKKSHQQKQQSQSHIPFHFLLNVFLTFLSQKKGKKKFSSATQKKEMLEKKYFSQIPFFIHVVF